MTGMAPVFEALTQALPAGRVHADPAVLAGYAHDEAEWAPHGQPSLLVRPRDANEVAAAVRVCAQHQVPLVCRGAGTGLSGGANAIDGCVILSFEAMAGIVDIDPVERRAVVQPGVINDELRSACAGHGLWYPPDPASSPWSTIGGNVATNAGGVCCVKYGVTRDYVLGLQAVLADGRIVRLGRRTAKGVAGYDLCGLLVGSEGTLGVITEITLRLLPARPPELTVVGAFDSVIAAGHAVREVTAAGIIPSALELVDRHCLLAVDAWKNMGLSTGANVLLLGRVDDAGQAGEATADAMVDCFHRGGAGWAARSTDPEEADELFAARRLAYPALERIGPVLTEDVCVPRASVPDMLEHIEAAARTHDTQIANVAHAGDGNLHPLIITQPGDDDARHRAQEAFEDIIDAALSLGGTVTGEHGVGLLKRRGLAQEAGEAVLDMHAAIKNALDPAGILNPGKIFSQAG
jgi:glycolate oxidase